jgi:hypothetical protein
LNNHSRHGKKHHTQIRQANHPSIAMSSGDGCYQVLAKITNKGEKMKK